MFQILDNFRVTAELKERYAGVEPLAEGNWFTLDPEQTQQVTLPIPGQMATITKPDGGIIVAEVVEARKPHSVIGLQFKDLEASDIPRLSIVNW